MSLTFTPKILRYANLYFFIQNLSEWHLSNRKKHNEEWRKELFFSVEADSCVQVFRKIHEQYSFGDKYLGRPFFLYDNPWPSIKNLVGKDNSVKIKNIFTILEPYFDILYKKDEIALKKWATIIAEPVFKEKASYLNNTLANFYGCPPYNEHCTIYLLLSTKEKNGGTAGTIDNHSVTLELSRTSLELEKHALNILWHELIHLYFRNHTLYPFLEKYTNSNLEIMKKIDEFIASSLLPNGLLRQHILATIDESKISKSFNTRVISDKIIPIQKLICPYLKEKRVIDVELVEKLCVIHTRQYLR
jgi:hypothetical protein